MPGVGGAGAPRGARPRCACPARAGASAGGYYLGGQTPAAVTAGGGRLDLSDVAAADAGGRLQALFTLRLPQPPAQLTALPFLCGPALRPPAHACLLERRSLPF
jgi:hypothetical protein